MVKINTYATVEDEYKPRSNSPPVSIQNHGFTYQSIQIRPTISHAVKDNFNSVLVKVKKDLNSWSVADAGLHVRVWVIKMNILPQNNFLFSMLPLSPPTQFFKALDSMFRKFICYGKHPRLSFPLFSRPKISGGLSLPNFKHYCGHSN